jgi:hypothetical protein
MTEDEWDEAWREQVCSSRRTVQVGPISAIDMQCMRRRFAHNQTGHLSERTFGDVRMSGRWSGDFEERDG